MAQMSVLDFMLARALAAGLAHETQRMQERPPPDNYFVLANDPQAWEQFKETSKKENLVICVEFVTQELTESTLFMNLARDHDGIPCVRVKVGEGLQESFEKIQKDVGSVTDIPSWVVVYFSEEKTYRVKYEGVKEIIEGLRSGTITKFVEEFVSRRVKLKMDKMVEQRAQQKYEVKEQQLRQEYEEKMREIAEREGKLQEETERKQQNDDNLQQSLGGMLDVLLTNALASGLAHDQLQRQESSRPPPKNYFVLSNDPEAWKQFKEDCKKENLVFCIEFIDEDMSSFVFLDLAREFDGIPFVRVQDDKKSFNEVRKDVGGVESTPCIVAVYYGKDEAGKDKMYRAKCEGIQEIQNALIRTDTLKKLIGELISRRVALKHSQAMKQQLHDKEQQMQQEYEEKMRELESKLIKKEEDAQKKVEEHQSSLPSSQPNCFCESMNPTELAEWLLGELGSDYQEDIDILKRNKINGSVFLKLPSDGDAMRQFGFSFGFKKLLPDKVKELTPSYGIDQTDFMDWKSAEKKIVKFSEFLGPNDLAYWLYQEVGDDYKDDIQRLREKKINGRLFIQLEVNELELTYGFKKLVTEMIKKIKETSQTLKRPKKRIESISESQSGVEPATKPPVVQNIDDPGPLRITNNPRGQMRLHCKQGVVLTVRACGPGTLSYQWLKDEERITDDTLPHCTGATSDSLRFTSLLPEHSGSYKCIVKNESDSVESKAAELKVPATMKFTDFIKESSECQDGVVSVDETLKEHFTAYLQRYGYTYADDPKNLEKALADILANATVNYDDAIIDFQTQKQMDKKLENIGDPKLYANPEMEDHNEQFQRSVTYSIGSESTKTNWSGWSTSGGVTASYQGAGASAAVGYERGKAETHMRTENTERTEIFDECVHVPSETRVKVVVEKQFVVFKCNVSNLHVTFKKKKAQIKCKVYSERKDKNKTDTFMLEKMFSGNVLSSSQKGLVIRMNGKCMWSETSVYLRRFNPEPLQGLDIM